jgi:hypothetical protein
MFPHREPSCRPPRRPHRVVNARCEIAAWILGFVRSLPGLAQYRSIEVRLLALKGLLFPQPRATPWEPGRHDKDVWPVQRTNNSPRIWRTDGPLGRFRTSLSMSPGRCPGLGEHEGLRPTNHSMNGMTASWQGCRNPISLPQSPQIRVTAISWPRPSERCAA